MTLSDFLQRRFETDGFTTEDALASFLPLARETLEAHANGLVAPLEGLHDLQVNGNRIWFEISKRRSVRPVSTELRRMLRDSRSAVEIIQETRITTEVDDGSQQVVDLSLGSPEERPSRPVYLPGYLCWEHSLDTHDPLTDIFSLGMILASLTCSLDFHDAKHLEQFVSHRNNLFLIQPDLHPVIARVIVRMTELHRHRRSQDLASLIKTLENYRDQEVDFDFDLARQAAVADGPPPDREKFILSKLRDRLFEISRRNKLLHFESTMQSVNLTHASVPLSFDIQNIRPNQILVWNEELQKEIVGGNSFPLNKWLNFSEILYLPSQMERLIAESKRDESEYGFSQLQLVICFLQWANLKEKPVQRYHSPLVLLPVRLRKKKGIRETFYLDTVSSTAEINPVIRHHFRQLYGIVLPETIDLTQASLDDLFELLSNTIKASEPAVQLIKVDRPRISLIHEKARRKLDQFIRRARLTGRGTRRFQDIDYSYDPANYHPLGIKLFSARIRPASVHLRDIIEEKPRPRTFAAPEPDPPVAEQERQFYAMQTGEELNPYDWSFDLCSVTLANFKYRRMSLVRDYDSLLNRTWTNPAFEATFSLSPRPIGRTTLKVPEVEHRYDVVPCDPTQATAIAEAAEGKSFIIQGPPGTGKSQTITNLIADFVARGKRVLFVCEKRAAIDVVFARLRQCGLADLCCLIHDSQSDKKEFVMNLKQTYERLLAMPDQPPPANRRTEQVRQLSTILQPLQRFNQAMRTERVELGTTVRSLLDRCIELQEPAPTLDAMTRERLPLHAEWLDSRPSISRFERIFRDLSESHVLAEHPFRWLSPRLANEERPIEQIHETAKRALSHLERAESLLRQSGAPDHTWQTLEHTILLCTYAQKAEPLASAGLLPWLSPEPKSVKKLSDRLTEWNRSQRAIQDAEDANKNWRDKLSAEDTQSALEQARRFENGRLPWLAPSWWRLRKILRRAYNFQSHQVRPAWTRILSQLEHEHLARDNHGKLIRDISQQMSADEGRVEEWMEGLRALASWLVEQPDWVRSFHAETVNSARSAELLSQVVQAQSEVNELNRQLTRISDDTPTIPFGELKRALAHLLGHLDEIPRFVDCLRELLSVSPSVTRALRTLPYSPRQIEAAVATTSLQNVYRSDSELERFTANHYHELTSQLRHNYEQWLQSNATELCDRVRNTFLQNVRTCEQPAEKLSTEQKDFKRRYTRGRRALEHEFGKQMRYKAIRDLVLDDSGEVIKDIKPVWLMSPLSVSDTLPLNSDLFDVVIFDEASQITLEEAVPALFRAPQSIIVGDEMQLPPTDFFSSKQSTPDDDEWLVESDDELVEYDLDSGSFLSHASKNLSSTMLGWHYRSRSESLISFSNWAFYDGRLLTVPESSILDNKRQPIVASKAEDGRRGAIETLQRSISFHRLTHGVYDKRRNRAEAEYIAEMVRQLLKDTHRRSIGIVAFSEAQQEEIEQALWRLAEQDKEFRDSLEREFEREEDGQFVGLLVKNLENIQGDERDIIILSICYGRPPVGKMRMNFGPINKSGGEKRLNVAFSRAKCSMAVVSSIDSSEITNEYNDGANCLKNYLRYSEAVSNGDAQTAARITRNLARWTNDEQKEVSSTREILAEQLSQALTAAGYRVAPSVGQSHFRCDLAVYRDQDSSYRLGILLDGQPYYQQSDVLERDLMRPRLLQAFGWKTVHVFAKDWFANRNVVLQRILSALEGTPTTNA